MSGTQYEDLKRCLRTKNVNAHGIVAEILCHSTCKEYSTLCKFLIVFISQYVSDLNPNTVCTIHKNIMLMISIADPSKAKCQEAASCVVENILAVASEKLQQVNFQDTESVENMQHGDESHILSIQVMKNAMCSRSFRLLSTMCAAIKDKKAERAIALIVHMVSHKSLIIQRIQYPDISGLKPIERHHILWYCWKALLYCNENKVSEPYIRNLLSLYVLSYTRRNFLESIHLLFHACKIACMAKTCFNHDSSLTLPNLAVMYQETMDRAMPPSSASVSQLSPALMYVPFYKS